MRAGKYAPANWEERMTKLPVTTSQSFDRALDPRALVVGLTSQMARRALIHRRCAEAKPNPRRSWRRSDLHRGRRR